MIRRTFLAAALVATLIGPHMPAANAADTPKLVVGPPGVPPIFAAVNLYVAEKEGFFKKHGVDVTLRSFDSGTAAARAVVAGDLDLSMSPTPLVINQIANAGVNIVAVYGMDNPDWTLGTTDASKAACKDIKGQQVGVDTPGGARSIALKTMLIGCGLKLEDVQQVALGSNTAAAMIAGQIKYGVLHIDDVPEIESHGKKITIITSFSKAAPTSHYILYIARKDKVAANREAYVRFLAGVIDASHFMADPKNAAAVAQIATVTGRSKEIAEGALKRFLAIEFWPVGNDGLNKKKLEATTATQEKIGNIKAGKTPPSYDQLVDASIWRDAEALTKKK